MTPLTTDPAVFAIVALDRREEVTVVHINATFLEPDGRLHDAFQGGAVGPADASLMEVMMNVQTSLAAQFPSRTIIVDEREPGDDFQFLDEADVAAILAEEVDDD